LKKIEQDGEGEDGEEEDDEDEEDEEDEDEGDSEEDELMEALLDLEKAIGNYNQRLVEDNINWNGELWDLKVLEEVLSRVTE
jgi:hypothetical protein